MQATQKAPALSAITLPAYAVTLTADNAALVLGIVPRSPRVPSDAAALAALADFGVEGAELLASLEAA